MQSALALLPGRFLYRAPAVLEHGWRATEAGETWRAWEDECCFQPGCPEQATVEVRKVAEYCRRGHKTEPHRDTRRRFCERHKRRGDGGLDDADMNYEVVALRLPDGQWKHVGSQPWVGAPREA